MSDSHDKNTDQDSFVEAFKSLPPIPKAKNEAPKAAPVPVSRLVEKPKHQPSVVSPLEAVLMNNKPKNDFAALQTALMQALSFSSKDLAINREGEISGRQKRHFRNRFLAELLVWAGIVGFMMWLTAQIMSNIVIGFAAFLLIPVLAVVLFLALSAVQLQRKNLVTGHAASYTGRVRKHRNEKENLLIVINHAEETERIFVVEPSIYNAFVEGVTYTLYMPTFANTHLISAEPVTTETQ